MRVYLYIYIQVRVVFFFFLTDSSYPLLTAPDEIHNNPIFYLNTIFIDFLLVSLPVFEYSL